MLVVKHFYTGNYSEFHDFLLQNKILLKNIHSSEKYLIWQIKLQLQFTDAKSKK